MRALSWVNDEEEEEEEDEELDLFLRRSRIEDAVELDMCCNDTLDVNGTAF